MGNTNKSKVFIVDDIAENLMVLNEILKDEYDVTFAKSGEDALHILKSYTPDIVLLDIMMPEMDGYQLCYYIKSNKKTKNVPIIFLSAKTREIDQLKGFDLGAVDYLTKPVNQVILKAKLNAHLKVKGQREELKNRVQQSEKELDTARIEIIDRLSAAAQFKDSNAGDHLTKMSRYCYIIAKNYGLSDRASEILLKASPLHDIGKIGISDSILSKKGKLNENEWKVMTTHSEIGAKIIDKHTSELLNVAYTVAYQHHEKWNGEGYPLGLKGEEIDVNARIAAVADVFDALTSERPYRGPWETKKAIDYINEESGQHFDPDAVKAFNASIDDILKVKSSYENEKYINQIMSEL